MHHTECGGTLAGFNVIKLDDNPHNFLLDFHQRRCH